MATTKWIADPETSEVFFKVSQFVFEDFSGYLKKFNLEVATEDDDFTKFYGIVFTADLACVDTNDKHMDIILKSSGVLDVSTFRSLKFVGKKYECNQDRDLLIGQLTIKDVVRLTQLDVEFGGKTVEMGGSPKIRFSVQGRISRKEYGLSCNALSHIANLVIGDEVSFNAEINLTKIV